MVNRASIEQEAVNALRAYLLLAGKSVATDGTNADLTAPMRQALSAIGITPETPLQVSDADIAKIPIGKLDEFLSLVQYNTATLLVGNITGTTSQLGPRRESTKEALTSLNAILKRLGEDTAGTRQDPQQIGQQVWSMGAAPVWGVWRPTGAAFEPTSLAAPRIVNRAADTPATPNQPDPVDEKDVVIDVAAPTVANYGKVYVASPTSVSGPVAVQLPPIVAGDDGKAVRVMHGPGTMPVTIDGQGKQITGLVAGKYQTAPSITLGAEGESVLLVADEDNNRWLVAEHEGPLQAVEPPTTEVLERVFDINIDPEGSTVVTHNLDSNFLDISAIDVRALITVTLGIKLIDTNKVQFSSRPGGRYIVTIRERKQ